MHNRCLVHDGGNRSRVRPAEFVTRLEQKERLAYLRRTVLDKSCPLAELRAKSYRLSLLHNSQFIPLDLTVGRSFTGNGVQLP